MKKILLISLSLFAICQVSAQWLGTSPVYFNSGFVGIGTSNPQGYLHVNPVRPVIIRNNGGNGVYGSEIGFNSVLNTAVVPNQFRKLGGTSQQGGANIAVDYTGNMFFQMANAPGESESIINYGPQITFQNTGNVGIGTTSPVSRLHVSQTSNTNWAGYIYIMQAAQEKVCEFNLLQVIKPPFCKLKITMGTTGLMCFQMGMWGLEHPPPMPSSR